jgi:hypothetical protein
MVAEGASPAGCPLSRSAALPGDGDFGREAAVTGFGRKRNGTFPTIRSESGRSIQRAERANRTIPIVFTTSVDPVAAVTSLASTGR